MKEFQRMLNRKLDDLQNNQEMKWKRERIAIVRGQRWKKCVCAIFPTLCSNFWSIHCLYPIRPYLAGWIRVGHSAFWPFNAFRFMCIICIRTEWMKIGEKNSQCTRIFGKNFKVGTGKDLLVSNAGNWFVGFSNIISRLVRRVLSGPLSTANLNVTYICWVCIWREDDLITNICKII